MKTPLFASRRTLAYFLGFVGGVFLLPYSAFALSSTGSLDSALYSSGDNGYMYAKFSTTFYESGFQYRPGAGHNICTVSITAASNATSTLPSLGLKIYDTGGSTPATSSTQWLSTGTLIKSADSHIQIPATYTDETFTLTPCLFVGGGRYYNFVFTADNAGSSGLDILIRGQSSNLATTQTYTGTGQFIFAHHSSTHAGSATWTNGYNTCTIGGNYTCLNFVLNGTENFSNFTASSTTSYSSTNCTPPNDILDIGGGFSYALCYMFVPSQSVIDQFSGLKDLLGTKEPFSYVSSINTAFGNITLNATSSFPLINIPLSTVASSTITGVMPDITFSTSTIGRYYNDSIRIPLNTLLTAVIWLGAGWKVWGIAMAIFAP